MDAARSRAGWLAALLFAVAVQPPAHAASADPVAPGKRIYLEGQLDDGRPVQGERGEGGTAEGAVVACANCHRRSGLGSAEGSVTVPPITARYLFEKTGVAPGRPTLTAAEASDARRAAYDDASLARAIREGVGRGGRPLSYLMPRYRLDGPAMASLIAYLRSLPTTPSPGVSDTTIDFATVVTPDADPVARDGMLAVLQAFFDDKNSFIRGGARPLRTEGRIDYRVERRWQLHVWRLSGPPSGWQAQLQAYLHSEPVLAILSGIGGDDWSPVHAFCEQQQLPCLFPNVHAPVDREQDFYPLYLDRGALLEADLLAQAIGQGDANDRLVQVVAQGTGGEAAAVRLADRFPASNHGPVRTVAQGAGDALAAALADVRATDTLVLWLDPASVAAMPARPPTAHVYLSGGLAGLEAAPLPPAWRAVARMAYPADLPAQRAVRMNYPVRWMQIHHIDPVAPKVQADTYLACGIVAEALRDMLDSFMRDFLVERIESMVSHRQLTAYYPRLGLAQGQRFASKGGYIVRFAAAEGSAVEPIGEWQVP